MNPTESIRIVHVMLDHETRLRAIERKLGIKIQKPDRNRILNIRHRPAQEKSHDRTTG